MAPEQKAWLLSPDPRHRKEQERSEVFALSMRLIAEAQMLRAAAVKLQQQASALISTFKRDDPKADRH